MELIAALGWAIAGLVTLAFLLSMWVRYLLRRLRKVKFDGRSQATRYGQITENFAPFMQSWPWDPKQFRFIGSPIDGVQFNEDGVVFVEIKSASSRLSPSQQRVKAQVEAGHVSWREIRVS
ncbi:MAG: Holliday junction resolvase-like protein [bacterium]